VASQLETKFMKISILLSILITISHIPVVSAQDDPKAEIVVQTGHSTFVYALAISPDEKLLASGDIDGQIKIWDLKSHLELRTFAVEASSDKLAFSADGTMLASLRKYDPKELIVWDLASARKILSVSSVDAFSFMPQGNSIALHRNGVLEIKDISGKTELAASTRKDIVRDLVVSPDGRTGILVLEKTFEVWEFGNGKLNSYDLHTGAITSVAFSNDGGLIVSSGLDGAILWDAKTAKPKPLDLSNDGPIRGVRFGSTNKSILYADDAGTVMEIEGNTSREIKKFYFSTMSNLTSLAGNHFGNLLAVADFQGNIGTVEIASGRQINGFKRFTSVSGDVAVNRAGTVIASAHADSIKLYDLASGTLDNLSAKADSVFFSPDGRTLISGGWDNVIRIWDVETRSIAREFKGNFRGVKAVSLSPDETHLAVLNMGDRLPESRSMFHLELRNLKTGATTHTFPEFEEYYYHFDISVNNAGKVILSAYGGQYATFYASFSGKEMAKRPIEKAEWDTHLSKNIVLKTSIFVSEDIAGVQLVDARSKSEICKLYFLDQEETVVTTPGGLFDATLGGRKLVHYAIGLEPIALDQMKDAYYVPGLLSKIMKGDPLPRVELFSKKDLFPDVEFEQPKAGQGELSIKVTNRGGGIGAVQVLVNGKEFVADARPTGFDSQVKTPVTLNVSLKNAPFIAGEENKIEVIARNLSGSLTNRGTARGAKLFTPAGSVTKETPNVYAIVAGISNYTGDSLKLNYAAKDAEDFAKAIEIGAVKMLGDKSKVHIRLLTSTGADAAVKFDVPDAKVTQARKEDIERAFADFSGATANDVFIVYLAGHGTSVNLNQNGAGGHTYFYLTQEATSTDMSQENIRRAMTVSSEELKDLMKLNKALKQVLILDTCAAGAVSGAFVAKRDLPSDQINALERLKDNTGFYVLMGSSSDAVSYEASQYGQGLLTYALLHGMQGAKLTNDEADVESLFGYAKDKVVELAKNIGGIQRPETITPDVSRSFPIGRFTANERSLIKLSAKKPQILRPNLQNDKLRFDNLKLTALLRTELRAFSFVSVRGEDVPIVFVDADEMPDAIIPSGGYTIDGDDITITAVLVKNNEPFGSEIKVAGKVSAKEELVKRLVAEIVKAAN
jgi:WD40 repeat protein/uncharacterized caspase-like protein